MRNTKLYGLMFCVWFFLILGCNGVLDEPSRTGEEGTVSIRIAIQDIQDATVRTVLPAVSLEDITRYELWGNSGDGEMVLASFTDVSGAALTIEQGTWDFTLKAFQNDLILLQGTVTGRVIAVSGEVLYFTLKPLDGTGGISIVINFPANGGIVSAVALTEDAEETLSLDGNRVVYDKPNVPSGDYFISFQLKDSDGAVLAVYSELILVGANLTSTKSVTLTEEDLKFRLLVPANLQAVPSDTVDTGEIQLTWNPVAGASGYRVYRSDTAAGNFVFLGNSDGVLYADSNVTAETMWYYKVSAVNSNNVESILSESVSGKAPLKIISFSFASPAATGIIAGTAITVTIPSVVNSTSLIPSVTHTGVSISPGGSEPQDFSNPVSYTITAQNGTTLEYTVTVTVADPSIAGALTWLAENAESDGEYYIKLYDDEMLSPQVLSFAEKDQITISIDGGDTEKHISLDQEGSLFTVESGVTVTLNGRITLNGLSSNNSALITVNTGGTLTMNNGVTVTGNANSGNGGGVAVSGTFTMNGGEISGNSALNGGGVYVATDGVFTKQGGVIFGSDTPDASGTLKNTATDQGSAVYAGTNKIRNYSAAAAVGIDSSQSGMAGGFEGPAGISVRDNQEDLLEWDLLTQPQIIESGTSTDFTVNGVYARYQWYLDGVPVEDSAVYTFSATGDKTEGVYELIVRVHDTAGKERSGRCRITVHKGNSLVSSPLGISLNVLEDWNLLPPIREIPRDTASQFTVDGSYETYQWYLDGSLVGTDSTYSFDSAGTWGGEIYELAALVTDNAGEQRAGTCRVTIIKDPVPEHEKPQPAVISLRVNAPEEWNLFSQNYAIAGNTVTQFDVEGTYTAYQWYLDGNPMSNDASYAFDATGKQAGEVYELALVVTNGNAEQRSGRCRITIKN